MRHRITTPGELRPPRPNIDNEELRRFMAFASMAAQVASEEEDIMANRPVGMPSLVTPMLANPVMWFEDFHTGSYQKPDLVTSVESETVATDGHANWFTTITGNGYAGNGANSLGTLNIRSGTTAGNATAVDQPNNSASLSSYGGTVNLSGALEVLLQARFQLGGAGSSIASGFYGVGVVPNTMTLGDWWSDPDIAFGGAAQPGLVITRMATAYSGAGTGSGTTGALTLRTYDASGFPDQILELVSAPVVSTYYKVEIHKGPSTTGPYKVYVDGALVGSFSTTSALPATGRWAFGVTTQTASMRFIMVDSIYQEHALSSAR